MIMLQAAPASKNNNHRLGRILWPGKIKGEWERDRLGGRGGLRFYGDRQGLHVFDCAAQSEQTQATSYGIHTSTL